MRSTSKRVLREQALSTLRAPTSSNLTFVGDGVFGGGDRMGESHSIRNLEESPPRLDDWPSKLAVWYFCMPPRLWICASSDVARGWLEVDKALESCFWRLWCLRIRVRVAREDRVGRALLEDGGRVLDRSLGL